MLQEGVLELLWEEFVALKVGDCRFRANSSRWRCEINKQANTLTRNGKEGSSAGAVNEYGSLTPGQRTMPEQLPSSHSYR